MNDNLRVCSSCRSAYSSRWRGGELVYYCAHCATRAASDSELPEAERDALRTRAEAAEQRAEGEAAGRAAERARVLALVRTAYESERDRERLCGVDPSAASGALDVLEQRIERGDVEVCDVAHC